MDGSATNRLSGYLPLLAFLSAWTMQLVYFLAYDSRVFYTFQFGILFLIFLTVASYTGGFFGPRLVMNFRPALFQPRWREPLDARAVTLLMRLSIFLAAGIIVMNILLPLAQGMSLGDARQVALDKWEEGDILARFLAALVNITISFCLVSVIDRIDLKGKFPLLMVLLFVTLSIAAYSRAHLLFGLCVISVKWISQSKYKLSFIFLMFAAFALLFSILSVVASISSNAYESRLEDVLRNLEVYAFGGVAGFEYYYTAGYPQFNSLLTVPRFIYYIVPGLGIPPPSYFPFIDTSPPINVFSAMYPPFHDYGVYGLAVFFFAYGLISSVAIAAFNILRNRLLGVLSGFLLYAGLMSPFDDQFIRGLTVLILMLSGVLLYSLLYRVLRATREQRVVARV